MIVKSSYIYVCVSPRSISIEQPDRRRAMPHGGFSGRLTSPKLGLAVDMGHPFLNHAVDGFIKIGAVKQSNNSIPCRSAILYSISNCRSHFSFPKFIIFIMQDA